MINNGAMLVGGALSCLVTKQRPHNLAIAALSYIGATQAQDYYCQHVQVDDIKDRLELTTSEYEWLQY